MKQFTFSLFTTPISWSKIKLLASINVFVIVISYLTARLQWLIAHGRWLRFSIRKGGVPWYGMARHCSAKFYAPWDQIHYCSRFVARDTSFSEINSKFREPKKFLWIDKPIRPVGLSMITFSRILILQILKVFLRWFRIIEDLKV